MAGTNVVRLYLCKREQFQLTVEVPQVRFIDRMTVVPVVVQGSVPTLQKVQKTV